MVSLEQRFESFFQFEPLQPNNRRKVTYPDTAMLIFILKDAMDFIPIKAMVYPKLKLFTHIHVIPNLYEFIYSVKKKEDILMNVGNCVPVAQW